MKLRKIYAENFMCYSKLLLDFEESTFLNFCGRNGLGKSTIIRMFEVMLGDKYTRDHLKMIKRGASSWKLRFTYEREGEEYIYEKEKYSTGQSRFLWRNETAGVDIYTNLLEDGILTAVKEMPPQLRELLQVEKDPATGEMLNIRTDRDRLFLVGTSDGDNYKVITKHLELTLLSDISKDIADKRNKKKRLLSNTQAVAEVLLEQVKETSVTKKSVTLVKEALERQEKGVNHCYSLADLVEKEAEKQSKEAESISEEVQAIDVERLSTLYRMLSTQKKSEEASSISKEVQAIDVERLSTLYKLLSTQKKSEELPTDLATTAQVNVIGVARLEALYKMKKRLEQCKAEISPEGQVQNLQRLLALRELEEKKANWVAKYAEYVEINENYLKLEGQLNEANKEIKGVKGYTPCPVCGTIVVTT